MPTTVVSVCQVIDTNDTEPTELKAVRLNITVKPETKARLDDDRNKKGIEINVSQVCDAAINSALDRAEKPGLSDLVARLRVESDRRRGIPFRLGHGEGTRWATEVGSWAEICRFAGLEEFDVQLGETKWKVTYDGESGTAAALSFAGKFIAPIEDYRENKPSDWGAPAYRDSDETWIDDANQCDQYWRGWLRGVRDLYATASQELEPIRPPAPAAGDVDPDDIPF